MRQGRIKEPAHETAQLYSESVSSDWRLFSHDIKGSLAHAGALVLSATTNEVGDSKAEMPADVEGSEIQIAFNARYVLDALGVIGEDQVELLFDGPLSPGLIRPPGKEHYLYVIMPVRVAMS